MVAGGTELEKWGALLVRVFRGASVIRLGRRTLANYKGIFVPITNGRLSRPPRDILTGSRSPDERDSRGRLVGVALGPGECRLVTDDVSNVVWRAMNSW